MTIRFKYKGKEYTGELSKVSGAGDTGVYHLMVDNYYWGRLRFSSFEKKWIFDITPKTEGMEVLADWMGKKVEKKD